MTKGERIKARREELGMTQTALADRIGESKQTVYKYESGLVSNIPSDKIELIARVLNTQPAYLMGWDVSEQPIPPGFEPLPEMTAVPRVGEIACGEPILAEQNIEGYFPIPTEYMPNKQSFMLKVKGESMINAGIFDGDKVLVKQQATAENGDIVVALVDDSATVKTYYKENGHYRLQPENDSMDPIIVDKCEILGKVFGVFRIFQ